MLNAKIPNFGTTYIYHQVVYSWMRLSSMLSNHLIFPKSKQIFLRRGTSLLNITKTITNTTYDIHDIYNYTRHQDTYAINWTAIHQKQKLFINPLLFPINIVTKFDITITLYSNGVKNTCNIDNNESDKYLCHHTIDNSNFSIMLSIYQDGED